MDIDFYKKAKNPSDLRKYCFDLARAIEDISFSDAIPADSAFYAYLRSAHHSLLQATWCTFAFDVEKFEYHNDL